MIRGATAALPHSKSIWALCIPPFSSLHARRSPAIIPAMTDPRIDKLANLLINYSCEVKAGEKILIEAIDVPHTFTKALVRAASAAGGHPLVLLKSNEVLRSLMMIGAEAQWNLIAEIERKQMESVSCYIAARGRPNVAELLGVPADKQKLYELTVWKPVHPKIRI